MRSRWRFHARFSFSSWTVGLCWFRWRNGGGSLYVYPFPMFYVGVTYDPGGGA